MSRTSQKDFNRCSPNSGTESIPLITGQEETTIRTFKTFTQKTKKKSLEDQSNMRRGTDHLILFQPRQPVKNRL